MQLDRLIEHITYESVQGSREAEITGICYHSGEVKEGFLFVCIKGLHRNGHDFAGQAVKNGAAAVITEEKVDDAAPASLVYVRDARRALAELAAAFYGYPAKKLKMIGITGTKGKTTTAFFIAAMLREAGYHPGLIGTVWIDDGREIIPAEHTTPEASDIQRYLSRMLKNGCDVCVMEVSSQGLKMQRVEQIWYDIGVFLNIEPDHIGKGEHASFSEYLHCKRKLMMQCDIGIVNADDVNVRRILFGHTCRVETFSMNYPADFMASEKEYYIDSGQLYSSFTIDDTWNIDREFADGVQMASCRVWERARRGNFLCSIPLPGKFNIYNALAAAAVAVHFGVTNEQMQRALGQVRVPGRCEIVSPFENYVVLLDYAHNEMSLKKLLETLRVFLPKRLVVLFGCGGNRSKLRRNRMGETAGLLADFTILTTDNPRFESPEAILDDIEEGILGTGGSYIRIPDRKDAVYYALKQAKTGDLIVIAGKGHEAYQEICGVKYPMSEKKLVADAAAKLQQEE